MSVSLIINGQPRSFPELAESPRLGALVSEMGLKADRVAIELNGSIAPKSRWQELILNDGDRLEIVHFVGGGCAQLPSSY